MITVRQGDILKVEKMNWPIIVLSKDFFNQSGEILACPVFDSSTESPLHFSFETREISGIAQCEKITLLDLNARRFTKIDELQLLDRRNVADIVQSIFDYL